MGAPEGNQFWKLRSSHGREKLFAEPKLLWEAACEFFQWCDENPFKEAEQARNGGGKRKAEVGTEGIESVPSGIVELPRMRPYTIQGLCIYLGTHSTYFHEFEAALKGKEDPVSKDFSQICLTIREIIYTQKFTGAAAGFFNPQIIARDLGLVDKKENALKVAEPLIIAFDGDGKIEVTPPATNQPPIP